MASEATNSGSTGADAAWWRQAVVYQVYPRSFADANGDGIGDLGGILSRVPYLAELGVDAVWLSPFYPSALADGGYDVDDYRNVDPRLGTLDIFDELVAALHGVDIRLIVDIVPNHTSNRHEWFVAALASARGSAERDRYIFRDGLGADRSAPPADWTSAFGGAAWDPVGDGQWYLHYFAREQPDLNWDNPEVRADFITTLRFWADRGVDGFRIDVAHGLAKKLDAVLPDQATLDKLPGGAGNPLWDRDEVHDIYAEWRTVFDSYDPPRTGVAEAWVAPARLPRYASPAGLGQAFNFDLLQADYDPRTFRKVIEDNLALAALSGSSTTWVLSNHDVVRHATRYGLPPTTGKIKPGTDWLLSGGVTPELDAELGARRARAATLLLLALPGSVYLYQGEELGLHEVVDIPAAARQDPAYYRSAGAEIGRDGCRVPLPWTRRGSSFGFGDDGAHLPQPTWFGEASVEAQAASATSTLALYRRALAHRRRLQAAETLEWVVAGATELHLVRPGGWHSITNFGAAPVALPDGELVLASARVEGGLLAPDSTAWVVAEG
jgi:alpha-glucosidase